MYHFSHARSMACASANPSISDGAILLDYDSHTTTVLGARCCTAADNTLEAMEILGICGENSTIISRIRLEENPDSSIVI